jgi:hypothetical protein
MPQSHYGYGVVDSKFKITFSLESNNSFHTRNTQLEETKFYCPGLVNW